MEIWKYLNNLPIEAQATIIVAVMGLLVPIIGIIIKLHRNKEAKPSSREVGPKN